MANDTIMNTLKMILLICKNKNQYANFKSKISTLFLQSFSHLKDYPYRVTVINKTLCSK